ncbi:mitochondrial 54S ribosomal protein uL6m MRPL6 [Rhodotorula paludigena]|uniref:mitochondrial 54S ribosomal protein uL6m MRPL6 n=1 Tax=Rhodotorula paludigena TaxID=86838 RepID=UPI00317AB66B
MPRLPAPLAAAAAHWPRPAARAFSSAPPTRSHVGAAPIPLPPSVSFIRPSPPSAAGPGAPAQALVRGPKGELAVDIAPFVRLDLVPSSPPSPPASTASPALPATLSVSVDNPAVKSQRAVWGLTRALLANAVVGVADGYTLPLRLVGVGYRAAVESLPPAATPATQRLNLKLGFAHPVLVDLPADVRADVPSPNSIVLSGVDKQRLGQVAARIRSWRVPEPYNGKGIFVGDEQVRRKEVKKK